ncbi:MAG: hypothetical protein KGQ66_01725 [Acidobacteriota bacterium]|nr:hypothetical protein [Acidobacteriota bacterium]
MWRHYRALPGRAQGALIAAAVVLVVIAAAVGGASRKATNTSQSGAMAPGPTVTTLTSPANRAPIQTTASTAAPSTTPATAIPALATTPSANGPSAVPQGPGACHVSGAGLYVLPDPGCTPGEINPDVTQSDIASTICAYGWTSTIRPPESYTEPLKIQQMSAYGETGSLSSYEEDHLISLELGGSPTDPRNLWPEPGASPNPKDEVENAARRAVCDGQMSLASAQQAIATNWVALGQQLGVVTGTGPATGSSATATGPATGAVAPSPPPVASPATPGAPGAPSAPGAPGAPAAVGCSPTTPSGNCYQRGEYCPSADRGATGTDASGGPITCEDVNGTWRWE